MTSVFIVRPFNVKKVTVEDKDGGVRSFDVDFEEIDRTLIQPALEKAGLEGATTQDIAKAGNIRLDMFQRLIAYDLVIADISIDNANAFYELGIRHGLRPQGTILIRFSTPGKSPIFDLQTDRYMGYDRSNPGAAVDALAATIRATIDGMQRVEHKPDSPIFLLLPELDPPNTAKLTVVPREFREAVERAENDLEHGPPTLALLAEEAKRTPWASGGVRLVALAQRRAKAYEAALESWSFVQKALPADVDANLQLATIYQRLGDLTRASQACQRVLDSKAAPPKARADARSQLARNTKESWVAAFDAGATEQERRQAALSDSRLIEAFEGYQEGFAEDLNDYYSGINALGLLTAIVRLAEIEPATWNGGFRTPRKAEAALEEYQSRLGRLRGAVRMSLDNAARKPDEYLPASNAQYELLTADEGSVAYIRSVYQRAKNDGKGAFSVQSEARQVAIFRRLGLSVANCDAALSALGMSLEEVRKSSLPQTSDKRDRVLVATGHRVDDAGRDPPRFPNTKDAIAKAKDWLREVIRAEKALTTGQISGIGSAASGTDLLFHEVCEELGIATKIVLPIPKDAFRRESVRTEGGEEDWIEKYNSRLARSPPIVLSDSEEMPAWAKEIAKYSVFQRANIWAMEAALLRPNADTTLIALWNGKKGDGPGGTSDMVQLAKDHGAKTCIGNTDELFGLPKPANQ